MIAVIFTSKRSKGFDSEYKLMASRMDALAKSQPGYVGVESVRNEDGVGITVSYWDDMDAVQNWQRHPEHLEAQRLGRERWYEWFRVRVCNIERMSANGVD